MKNLSQQIDSPPTQQLKKKDLKPTEVGWIPEDWELLQLKDCIKEPLQYGIGAAATDYNLNLPRYLRITDISEEGNLLEQNKASVDVSDYSRYLLKNDDIVLARTGASVGKSYHFNSDNFTGDIVFAGFLIKVSTDKNELSPLYLKYYLQSNNYWNWVKVNSMRSGQPGINSQEYSSLYIPLPPTLAEQRAIATALSDVDELIRALDALIQKKEAIKKGSMQQLLTGKQRLPGFEGEWEVKMLGNISTINTGDKNNQDKVSNGIYPFFVRSQEVKRINSYSFDGKAILVPGEGGIGSIYHYINGKFDYHQRVYKISDFKESVDGKFIYYMMLHSFYDHAMEHSVKATVDSLRLPTFKRFEIIIPKQVEEQKSIVRILDDMDREIQVLRQKREKAGQIKQGMMQELLTGKTRLI